MKLLRRNWVDEEVVVINVDNNRDPKQIARELGGLAAMRVLVIFAVETIGSGVMPELVGYVKYDDRTNDGRKNICMWVRSDVPSYLIRWIDHSEKFPRKDRRENHPARASVAVMVGEILCATSHAPPDWRGAAKARTEWLNVVGGLIAPWLRSGWNDRRLTNRIRVKGRRGLLGADHNGLGPRLAAVAGYRRHGSGPDSLFSRRVRVRFVRQIDTFNGVPFLGDHHDALLVGISVPPSALTQPARRFDPA